MKQPQPTRTTKNDGSILAWLQEHCTHVVIERGRRTWVMVHYRNGGAEVLTEGATSIRAAIRNAQEQQARLALIDEARANELEAVNDFFSRGDV